MANTESLELSADMPLAATWTRADREARAVVLVGGAVAVPRSFYARWAQDLADRGYDVLTFDYRGIGGSRPSSLRGFDATLQDWGRKDLGAALAEAERQAAGRPVLYVGHSFGGQALGLVDGGERLAGGVVIASGWGFWGYHPWWKRPGLVAVMAGLLPSLALTLGHVPGGIGLGAGLPGGVAREWARWCRHPDYLLAHVPDARERFARVTAPFHVLTVSDDGYIPGPAVAQLAAVLPNGLPDTIDASAYGEGLGHFGAFRPYARPVWDDLAMRLSGLLGPRDARQSA
ncbi:MAG: alpha/beta fold hydrolase [Myxococcales bacterium]|nr:alpha/beta fold hydrolase [Myxococcales bacterium]